MITHTPTDLMDFIIRIQNRSYREGEMDSINYIKNMLEKKIQASHDICWQERNHPGLLQALRMVEDVLGGLQRNEEYE